MRAVFARNSLQFRAVELRRIKLPLARIIFVAGEVNNSRSLIDAIDPKHLKISLRELALELGVPFKQLLFVEAADTEIYALSLPDALPAYRRTGHLHRR